MNRKTALTALATVILFIVLLVGVFFIVLYSGTYNVAATDPHAGAVRWALNTAQVQSVRAHAEELQEPLSSDSVALQRGFKHFEQMCVMCHGAPGVKASEIGRGLNPDPPELSRVAERYSPGELYWIIEHGIKMSGMPAFGPTHSEKSLRAIVAFVEQLPELTPEEYQKMRKKTGSNSAPGAGHTHQNGH